VHVIERSAAHIMAKSGSKGIVELEARKVEGVSFDLPAANRVDVRSPIEAA
jgi:hypothetical protein